MFSQWSSQEQLVAQDWIQRDAKSRRLGRHCQRCPNCCYKRGCVIAIYINSAALCLGSLAILIIMAAGIVAPFHHSLGFVETTCMTTSSEYYGPSRGCTCSGRYCRSSYPCLRIEVRYQTTEGFNLSQQLHASQYHSGDCSYKPGCSTSAGTNKELVEKYRTSWGAVGTTYPCMYNPRDPSRVIRIRYGDHRRMVHALLWPGLLVVLFGTGIVVPVLVCGCHFLWHRQPPHSIRQEAEQRRRGICIVEYTQLDSPTSAP